MTKWTFEKTCAGYAKMWLAMSVTQDRLGAVDKVAKRIIAAKSRYLPVEKATGVPWFFIGVLHYRESNLNFKKHLHNGDPLTARTTRVPAGYPKTGTPPFTWEFSAIDALKIKSLQKIREWSVERMLYEAERFNGFGYMHRKGHNSPYVWGGTNHQTRGKFVRDGVFNANHMDSQIGVAAILKRVIDLDRTASPPLDEWKKPVGETVRQSVSLRSLIVGAFTVAVGGLMNGFNYLADGIAAVVTLLPSAVAQATDAASSAAAMAAWLKLEAGTIVNVVALGVTLLVIYRELPKKRNQP